MASSDSRAQLFSANVKLMGLLRNGMPSLMTKECAEVEKYLKMVIGFYDTASASDQLAFREQFGQDLISKHRKLLESVTKHTKDAQVSATVFRLMKEGKPQEALKILKDHIAKESDPRIISTQAARVVTILLGDISETDLKFQKSSSSQHSELYKYLKLALEAYDRTSSKDQQLFQRQYSIENLRSLFEMLNRERSPSPPASMPASTEFSYLSSEVSASKSGCLSLVSLIGLIVIFLMLVLSILK